MIDPRTSQSCDGSALDVSSCNSTSLSRYEFRINTCNVPTITAVSPSSISHDTLVTITGTGFNTNQCENEVLIGGKPCTISSNTATQIECRIGTNSGLVPNLKYLIEVHAKNTGFALHTDEFSIEFIPRITAFSNNAGSLNGGNEVTITGDGFVPSATTLVLGSSVYNDQNARITYTSITFVTNPEETDITHNITLYVNGYQVVTEIDNSYAFSAEDTPEILSVSPTSVSLANTEITISGNLFGTSSSDVEVKIGVQDCVVSTVTNTEIKCTLSGLEIGDQSVNLRIKSKNN